MSLSIYSYDPFLKIYQEISSGTDTNPITSKHDGFRGEGVAKKLFVRNDDASYYYSSLTVSPSTISTDITSGTSFLAKLYAGENEPADWSTVSNNNTITLDDVGSISAGSTTYRPFWFYIFVPKGTKVQTINDISLSLTYSEGIVS